MEEKDIYQPILISDAFTSPTHVKPVIPVDTPEEVQTFAEGGFTWLQKGLLAAVVFGCVTVYRRVNSKRVAERVHEKSLV